MIQKITQLIFECFHLKQIKHEGWRIVGVQSPDSVAEHSLTAAQIAYILAKMEGADPYKCATMLVWHDIGESRIGDLHKIASNYLDQKGIAEKRAMNEQFDGFEFRDDILGLFSEYESRTSIEGTIAKDADYLEQAFQARIYEQSGYVGARRFVENLGLALKTESAKKLWSELQKQNFWQWADGSHNKGVLKPLSSNENQYKNQ